MNFASKGKNATQAGKQYVSRVVGFISAALVKLKALDASIQVMAMEVQCGEPDCVPIETLVILVSSVCDEETGVAWRWTGKILKPIAEVTNDDVIQMDLPTTTSSVTAVDPIDNAIEKEKEGKKDVEDAKILKQDTRESTELSSLGAMSASESDAVMSTPSIASTTVAVPIITSASASTGTTRIETGGGGIKGPRTGKTGAKSVFRIGNMDAMEQREDAKATHKAGVRARGCPCCDPDNLDNMLDSLMFNPI